MTGAAAVTRPAAVLLYHRVADMTADPWGLSVDPVRFAEHLDALSDSANVLPASEVGRATARHNKRPTVALTFDDGYQDNLAARAALRDRDLPATFFVVSGNLGREFWWDELERLLLCPGVLMSDLRLSIGGQTYAWQLGDEVEYTADDRSRNVRWRVMESVDDPTPRHSLFRSLHALFMPLPETERTDAMAQVRGWVKSHNSAEPAARALSVEELRTLASDPTMEIGAHTVSHPALPSLSAKERRHEIRKSKEDLEELLGRPVRLFAYPFGICDGHTAAMVREEGFDCAWVIEDTAAGGDGDAMRLGRLLVGDWSGEELVRQIARKTDC